MAASYSAVVARLRAAGCVFAEDEARLLIDAAADPVELESMVRRRVEGVPLEPILGWVQFRGRRFAIEPGVFVPRARTEFLVEQAIAGARPGAIVVDLCCGSGALGAALAAEVESIRLYATDIDPVAVGCARRNIRTAGGQAYVGDLFAPLPPGLAGRLDIVLANVPYVPTEAIPLMPPEAREHEPRVALDGGADGLDVLRRVTAAAAGWLAPGGRLFSEISPSQTDAAIAVVTAAGLRAQIMESSEHGATVIVTTKAAR